MNKKKKILVITITVIVFLQLLQGFAGGDWLIGFEKNQHYFNIFNKDTQQFGMTFDTHYVFVSVPSPFQKLSYRLSVGKFISWGSLPSKPCLIGYSYFPVEDVETVKQCIGFSIKKRMGYIY